MTATWAWLASNRTSEPRCGGRGWIKWLRDIAEHAMGVSGWHGQNPEPIRSTSLPDEPWQDLAVDLMGPLPSGY